ncbi:MAG: phosphatase PAP2 family protein [bacterium]|nr:phosphatase PAP2 family protein [bacterium]
MIPEPINRLGADLILWLQENLSALYGPMELFTLLGEELFYMILIPLIYWSIHRGTGLRLLALITTSSFVNDFLKWTLHSPRPYWWDADIEGLRAESAFGPPSGHSQNAVTFWGYLTATLRRYRPGWRWLWPAFFVLAFLISFSRMLMGVHFPNDLLMGWTAGAIFLIAFWKLMPRFEAWFRAREIGAQIGVSFLISGAMLALALVYSKYLAGVVQIDPVFFENAAADQPSKTIAPFSAKAPVSFAAVVAGMGVGGALMLRTANFSVGGPIGKRVLRYLLGLVGVFAIYASGKFAPETLPEWEYLGLRYLRYFFMMLWAIWLAPLIFLKIGLASAAQETAGSNRES